MNKHKVVTTVVGLMALGGSVTGVALATAASATTPTTISVDAGPNDQSGSQIGVDVADVNESGDAVEAGSATDATTESATETTNASDEVGGHQDPDGVDVQFTGQQ